MEVVGCAWVLERCGRPVADSVIAWSLGSSSGPVSGMAGVVGIDRPGRSRGWAVQSGLRRRRWCWCIGLDGSPWPPSHSDGDDGRQVDQWGSGDVRCV